MKINSEGYYTYQNKHILLIEDDLDDQFIFRDVMQELNAGLTCSIVDNGLDGLRRTAQDPVPDLVFVDINLPVMNGFEYLNSIRKQMGEEAPPIIVFTTSNSEVDMAMAKELGAEGFISKPHTFDTFKQVLHRTLLYIFGER